MFIKLFTPAGGEARHKRPAGGEARHKRPAAGSNPTGLIKSPILFNLN